MDHTYTKPVDTTIVIGSEMFKLSYGESFNLEFIIQSNYPFPWGSEIEFYNRREEDIPRGHQSLTAVWHIKPKQLA